ncbi:MAG: Sjogren's syndrome/scleroderma autoantigen 1 family protein [Halolamina sp.]
MSEEFDKEAEREKLREKYERDQEKREATQQMSELLLKGATMTNSHCDRCGDPIFRMNGETFCPSCERTVDGDSGNERDGDVTRQTTQQRAEQGANAQQQATDDPPARAGQRPATGSAPTEGGQRQTPVPAESRRQETNAPRGTPQAGDADLAAGREALRAALTTHARHGADADDPRRAREHLEAAREAAEALATLQ